MKNDPEIAPSQIYAYAALKSGIPFANGAPNLTTDMPAMLELARDRSIPVCGKDFKTGQTFMKTLIAPGLKARMLGSTAGSPRIFWAIATAKFWKIRFVQEQGRNQAQRARSNPAAEALPELYKDFYHAVRINYYPPRGDAKEGWDSIDIFGWLGYPMQIKIDFLCRDSILAAPLVLDLVLFMDLAQRAGMRGIQEWLSFYFKGPMTAPAYIPSTIFSSS